MIFPSLGLRMRQAASALEHCRALASVGIGRVRPFQHALIASRPWFVVGTAVLLGLAVFFPLQVLATPLLASATSEFAPRKSVTTASVVTTAALPFNTYPKGYADAAQLLKAQETNTQQIKSSSPSTMRLSSSVPQSRNANVSSVRPTALQRRLLQIKRMPVNLVDPLQQAWQAYQEGEFTLAEQFYQQAMQQNPRQRDAVLGLAAIAQIRGDVPRAQSLYRRILQLYPEDAAVKQALLALPQAVTEQEVLQLEQSGQADPQVLAQFYASEQRWSQAQAQFFIVYSQNPSATAAFNLAVSLDHLQQPTLALQYYRQALQGVGAFDRSAVQQRITALSAPPLSSEAQHAAQY